MKQFSEVFKKEFKEIVRTKKVYIFLAISAGLVAFTFLVLGLMKLIIDYSNADIPLNVKNMFELSYGNAAAYFISMFTTYFVIYLIIILRNYMSKEIKEKKWVLPLECGIKPQNLVLARMLAITLNIILSVVVAVVLHLILCLILCKPDVIVKTEGTEIITTQLTKGQSISNNIVNYIELLVYIIFITSIILGLGAITKKQSIVIGVTLLLILVVDIVLTGVTIKIDGVSTTLEAFSPFLFAAPKLVGQTIPWSCYLSASITTVGVIVAMVVGSLFAVKIKGEKIK